MEKSLSQQICELCGIEARARGCTDGRFDCKGDCIDCTWYDADEYYINFENPENFVKLLELEVSPRHWTVWKVIRKYCRYSGQDCCFDVRASFLIYLKNLLIEPPESVLYILAMETKQAVREYNGWVWQ